MAVAGSFFCSRYFSLGKMKKHGSVPWAMVAAVKCFGSLSRFSHLPGRSLTHQQVPPAHYLTAPLLQNSLLNSASFLHWFIRIIHESQRCWTQKTTMAKIPDVKILRFYLLPDDDFSALLQTQISSYARTPDGYVRTRPRAHALRLLPHPVSQGRQIKK